MTFESLKNDIVQLCPASADYIELKLLADSRTGSFMFYNQVGFRMVLGKRVSRIEIPSEYVGNPEQISKTYTLRDDVLHINIDISFDYDTFLQIIPVLIDSLWESATNAPFGCCSSYVECSDEMRCLHHGNPEYAGCHYRRNLYSGRIFYGKNKPNSREVAQKLPDGEK